MTRTILAWWMTTVVVCAAPAAGDGPTVGLIATEGYDAVHHAAAAPDGSVVVCGLVSGPAAWPDETQVTRLLEKDAGSATGFVAALDADLSRIRWIAHFGEQTFCPTRVAVGSDGSIAVGGIRMNNLPEASGRPDDDWAKADTAVASVSADGSKLRWIVRGGPNQSGSIRREKATNAVTGYSGGITGLAIDAKRRVYYTAGTRGRAQAAYVIRLDPATGGQVPFARSGRGWCIDLHKNDPQLNRPGQFYHFYADDGRDYDGEGKGWGPVDFSVVGLRQGGQVVVLPNGDLVVTGTLQYDFRVKGEKKFPAFDLLVARYSAEGELRWSTNLYQPGDSVHTPDQKAVDLCYDAATGDLLVLAKQHGSNVYRFKGELRGDTGNLMISWLGRVDARTGKIERGWYFMNRRPGSSPKWPKLAGNSLRSVATDAAGGAYLAGLGGAAVSTTPGALAGWPDGQSGGSHGSLVVLDKSMGTRFVTVIRDAEAAGRFAPTSVVRVRDRIVLAGSVEGTGSVGVRAGWSHAPVDQDAFLLSIDADSVNLAR